MKQVADISDCHIALFFDAWEKSPDPKKEANILDAFLRHRDDWPSCHMFLALRPDDPALAHMESLSAAYPGSAKIHRLGDLRLEKPAELNRVVAFLHQRVPATARMDHEEVLDLIGGSPSVIDRWTSRDLPHPVETKDEARRIADNAHRYRFPELESLAKSLKGEQRKMAIRVALLPSIADRSTWSALREIAIEGLPEETVDDLKLAKVLDSADPPSFGHAKRWEAAIAHLTEHSRVTLRAEGKALILRLAQSITGFDPRFIPAGSALRGLAGHAQSLECDMASVMLCQSAITLFGEPPPRVESFLRGARQARALNLPGLAPLLAMGLFNTLNHAKAEDDLARRDALLDELRALAGAYPDDPAVRERLAMGLFNTLNHAKAEDDLARRDALLDELRALAGAYPADPAVRKQLAMGLFNTLNHAKAEDDLARRDALLDELRALAGAYPADAAVRKQLAMGLFNTLKHAKAEDDLARRDALLDELRALAGAYPDDAAVREPLAKGLFNTLNHAKAEDDLARRDALLDELRALAAPIPMTPRCASSWPRACSTR